MGVDLNLDYKGRPLIGFVAQPIDDFVVGVEVKSRPWILPRLQTPSGPPEIPKYRERHIMRTDNHVVVVDVIAKVHVHPRYVTMDQLRECGREAIEEHAPGATFPKGYAVAIKAFAHRLARQLRRRGVTIL